MPNVDGMDDATLFGYVGCVGRIVAIQQDS